MTLARSLAIETPSKPIQTNSFLRISSQSISLSLSLSRDVCLSIQIQGELLDIQFLPPCPPNRWDKTLAVLPHLGFYHFLFRSCASDANFNTPLVVFFPTPVNLLVFLGNLSAPTAKVYNPSR